MKIKFISILLAAFMLTSLCGCTAVPSDSGKPVVIAVSFPAYDFARAVCGDFAEVRMLLPAGTESHTYEPMPKDIVALGECNLLVRTGGESEAWLDKILESTAVANVFSMMDAVEAVGEEAVEGMQTDEDEHGEAEYDEHVWTSPANAAAIVTALGEFMPRVDEAHVNEYRANAAAYADEIDALDRDYADFFKSEYDGKPLIFGDRFPLLYFVREFGIEYYAAFPGCAAETEPSAATVKFLIDRVNESAITTVYYIELSTHTVADSIAEATGAKTALFHSCHNVAKEDFDAGVTYLSLMRENLRTLKGEN